MKKTIIAMAVAFVASGSAVAAEVYNDGTNTVTVGGRVDMTIGKEKNSGEGAQMSTGSSRINFGFDRTINDAVAVEGFMEWQVNLINGHDQRADVFRNRLGYVGLNDNGTGWGQLRAGKQWAAVYDVTGATDVLFISDHDAGGIYQFSDGGSSGTGRLDKGLTYQNKWGGFKLGLQYGMQNTISDSSGTGTNTQSHSLSRDSNVGGALSYEFDNGIKVGAAHTSSKMKQSANQTTFGKTGDFDIVANTLMAQYMAHGVHFAASYVDGKNYHMNGFAGGANNAATGSKVLSEKSQAFDAYASYKFDMGFEPYLYGSTVKMSGNEGKTLSTSGNIDGTRNMVAVGAKYNFDSQTMFGVEYRNIKHQASQRNSGAFKDDSAVHARLRYLF
ncbi:MULTISPECIES: porin [Vibrio]|uniref:porin n=1 Tax=Vibrio TaxID=662 RepID=UPI003D096077